MPHDPRDCVLPPKGEEWQVGQTAASVKFVRDTEIFISNCSDEKDITLLEGAVAKIKSHTKRCDLDTL